jgi:hypothetical protein
VRGKFFIILILVLALAATGPAAAQSKRKPARKPKDALSQRVEKTRADLVKAAEDYKVTVEKLITLLERDVKEAADLVEKRKALYTEYIVSKREVEQAEEHLIAAQAKVAEERKKIGETDSLIAEVRAEEQLAKLPPPAIGSYSTTAALIRYNGATPWLLADAAKVQGFFVSRFGRVLPISAFGQTAVHNRLGFDHRNSIDVAVHPDSAEGQALLAYLRGAGIPFIAFRAAVPGSATGAHIHIGLPSRRIR